MRGAVFDDGRAYLLGVYVSPAHRGGGVADALLTAVEEWVVTSTTAPRLLLDVHEDNPRAQRFYARRGYALTGRSSPYPLDPSRRELEMARSLR